MTSGGTGGEWFVFGLGATVCFGAAFFAGGYLETVDVKLTNVLLVTGLGLGGFAAHLLRRSRLGWVAVAAALLCFGGSFAVEPLLGRVPATTLKEVLIGIGGLLVGGAVYAFFEEGK